MKTAAILVRVKHHETLSSESSLAQQLRILQKYCKQNNINMVYACVEMFPKTDRFKSTEFKAFLKFLESGSIRIDMLLFTKLSVFSRNGAEAYMMKERLNELGVTIQAVEQPVIPFCITAGTEGIKSDLVQMT